MPGTRRAWLPLTLALLILVGGCSQFSGGKLVSSGSGTASGGGVPMGAWKVISFGAPGPVCVEGVDSVEVVGVSWEEDHGVEVVRFGFNNDGNGLGAVDERMEKWEFVEGPGDITSRCDQDGRSHIGIEITSADPQSVVWARGFTIHYLDGNGREKTLTQPWTVVLCEEGSKSGCNDDDIKRA
jgi:hypothetical protein